MNRDGRLRAIAEALTEHRRVAVNDLAETFGVSAMTVRRDLEQLERQQQCRRVHGGAVAAISGSYEPPFAVRQNQGARAKEAIASVVASIIDDGETVFLDIGTTTLAVARALRGRGNLTILTPSIPIVQTLADEPGPKIICLGGVVRRGEHSLIGSLTELVIRQFYFDVCVLGIGGVDAEAGLTEFNLDDAGVKRAALDRSQRVMVAADASKLGTVAFATVAPMRDVDVLVTDAEAAPARLTRIRDVGVDVRTD